MKHGPHGVNVPVKSVKTKRRPEAELAPTDWIQRRKHALLLKNATVCFKITSYYTSLFHDIDSVNILNCDFIRKLVFQ